MPTTPYAKLRISVNAGAPQTGGVTVASGSTIAFSFEDTSGWQSYTLSVVGPEGWSTPAGWTDVGGAKVFTGTTAPPSSITLDPTLWGKWMCTLTVNGGVKNGAVSADVVDTDTAFKIDSTNSVESFGVGEEAQFGGTLRTWTKPLVTLATKVEDALASVSTYLTDHGTASLFTCDEAIAIGDVVTFNSSRRVVIADAAAIATSKIVVGVALTATNAPAQGVVVKTAGLLSDTITGLNPASSGYVRVSSVGLCEIVSSLGPTDVGIGYAVLGQMLLQPGGIGASGSGWTTVFDIDFAALTPTSYTTDGTKTFGGYDWVFENVASGADSVALTANGLEIDCNTTNTSISGSTYTGPAVILPITTAFPTYDFMRHELRLWVTIETASAAGSTAAHAGFARYPFVVSGVRTYFWRWMKYYSGGTNVEAVGITHANAQYESTIIGSAKTFFQIVQKGLYTQHYFAGTGAASSSFDDAAANLGLVFSPISWSAPAAASNVNEPQYNRITKSSDMAIMLAAHTGNTAGTFKATFRRLRLDYL